MRHIFCLLLLCCAIPQAYAQYDYDTLDVYFPINNIRLDAPAMVRLDSLTNTIGNRNLLIYGYADYLGNEPANEVLANGRAENVRKYLMDKKISDKQILICAGIGEVNRTNRNGKEGYPKDRRVSIFIKRDRKIAPTITSIHPVSGMQKLTPAKSSLPVIPKTLPTKISVPSRFDELTELKPNQVLRIENIHFQPGRHFVTKESEPILNELFETLKNNENLVIRIEGHVCCMQGDGDALDQDTQLFELSQNRAKYICLYLITKGIKKERLSFAGFGKSHPIVAVELSEDDAKQNRRVEIRVLRN
jgi:outer membrane protein OmpA-like peptidoglycan-associated protein